MWASIIVFFWHVSDNKLRLKRVAYYLRVCHNFIGRIVFIQLNQCETEDPQM